MAKERKKKNPPQSTTPINVSLPVGMSAEEMQHVIAKALVEAERIKEQKKQEQKDFERKEWEETVGKNPVKRFFKILFLPKKQIKGDKTTFALLKMFIEMFFGLAKILTLLFSIFAIAYMPLQYVIETIPNMSINQNVILGVYAVLSFLFSRMFRMASIEVDKIEDRSLLFGIFASITSIVSIVVAIIAVVQGG